MTNNILHIYLLGDLLISRGSEPVAALNSARAQSLLAYLVLHAGLPQSRRHLAFLLWPDSSDEQARSNLRKLIHDLRRALPDADRASGLPALPATGAGRATAALSDADRDLPGSRSVSAGAEHAERVRRGTRGLQPAGGDVPGGDGDHRPRPCESY